MTAIIPGIVVFDIDGTLTDSVAQHQSAFETALRTFCFPSLRTDWGNYTHHTDSAIFEQAWEEAQYEGRADLSELEFQYRRALEHEITISPFTEIKGASAFLQWLKEHSWSVVFATGSLRFGAVKKLEAVGVDAEKVDLITASEFRTREEIVQKAIHLGSKKIPGGHADSLISIGDGLWDLKTANNLNLPFIGIGRDVKAKLLTDLGAPVFEDFTHLMNNGIGLFR